MEFKVVSLNLWDGGKLFEGALEFIKLTDPDILTLQEVYDGKDPSLADRFRTIDVLRSQLSYKDHYFAPEFIDNRQEGRIPQGNAIFTKFPILKRGNTFFDKPLDENYVESPENFPFITRNLQHALLDTPAGQVYVFNFHGVWDLEGEIYTESRKNMSKVLINAVKDKNNVILCGDTNAKPVNQAMLNVEQTLKSVFGNSVTTTFNMIHKDMPGYATSAVDMMFVSPNFEIASREVPQVDVSDHFPLVVKLKL